MQSSEAKGCHALRRMVWFSDCRCSCRLWFARLPMRLLTCVIRRANCRSSAGTWIANAREDLRKMQERREKLREERSDVKTDGQTSDFHFRLNGVEHNPSEVLTDEEIDEAVSPFFGREVSMGDVKNMLAAINARYREKRYVVCEARLKPQRIRAGRLFVTLIEGKTWALTVTGNEHTRDGYVLGAFDLEKAGRQLSRHECGSRAFQHDERRRAAHRHSCRRGAGNDGLRNHDA